MARQKLYLKKEKEKKNTFLSSIVEEAKPHAPSPGCLWWMKQVITEEFELRSFSRDFLSCLLNSQWMGPDLQTQPCCMWAEQTDTTVGTGGKKAWMDSAVGAAENLITNRLGARPRCLGKQSPFRRHSPFPMCILKISNKRKHLPRRTQKGKMKVWRLSYG